ncbi:GtrA family protein [Corynebacterium urealyticum]|uniref:GtrA family protein n=1 Tax=Corynebacterium urealyticum TaxID=43771 RepID=UPI0002B3F5A1|nr:GtrA family protein [Corynebacterium urealyticum]AGE37455.1 putative membrane protein [Corynebacterium urealyticum DSM 7111]
MTSKRPEQSVTSDARGEMDGMAANDAVANSVAGAGASGAEVGAVANGAPGAEATANGAAGAEAGAGDVVVKDNISLNQQIFRFILTGGLSAIVDFGSTAIFTFLFGFSDTVAKTIGFILGTLTAYMINRRWTFNAAPSTKRFVITMATYALTFAVQVGLYKLCIPWLEGMELSPLVVRLISFVIAQGTATVLNFLIQRFVIFRN